MMNVKGVEDMQCQTVRPGVECFFWKKSGCSFPSGQCNTIIDKCEGCKHILEFEGSNFCKTYPDPSSKWINIECHLATHVKRAEKKVEAKSINPLKASKRMAKGK